MRGETKFWVVLTPLVLAGTYFLSMYFPRITAFFSGAKLYTSTWFNYDLRDVIFDDSVYTWGTDYLIAAVMASISVLILQVRRTKQNSRLIKAGAGLLISYAVSTLAGAVCHNFLPGKLNTTAFRFFWRLCVGAVALGGAFMLGVGSCLKGIQVPEVNASNTVRYFVVPNFVLVCWGVFFFLLQWFGVFSMKQPACDIFMMGVTQTLPTTYMTYALLSQRKTWKGLRVRRRVLPLFLCGCLANVLLLPFYDVVNYLQLDPGVNNLIAHIVLLVSWSCQGLGVLEFAKAISLTDFTEGEEKEEDDDVDVGGRVDPEKKDE